MPSGKGVQRTNAQILADHCLIGDLLVLGYTTSVIWTKLNGTRSYSLSLRTVQKDIADIRTAWASKAHESFQVYLHRELKVLDVIQIQALEGWEKSKKNKVRRESEGRDHRGAEEDRILLKVLEETTPGDVGFLLAALRCSERRAKLLGLDKVRRQEDASETWPPAATSSVEIKIIGEIPNLDRSGLEQEATA